LLDRDHQIGHSYFLNNSDSLENIWYDNIMPLLNEYFYGDWEKLQNILGVAENENSDKTHKYNSFIKKISKSSLKLKGDTSCLDDYYYDFVPQENIDFEKAMKNAFGEISNEETNADN
jgi:5-methylcytosine-specific restriction protein B